MAEHRAASLTVASEWLTGLPLADLAGETSAAFAAADDWYLLLLDLDGDRVSAAIRSRFTAPTDVATS